STGVGDAGRLDRPVRLSASQRSSAHLIGASDASSVETSRAYRRESTGRHEGLSLRSRSYPALYPAASAPTSGDRLPRYAAAIDRWRIADSSAGSGQADRDMNRAVPAPARETAPALRSPQGYGVTRSERPIVLSRLAPTRPANAFPLQVSTGTPPH